MKLASSEWIAKAEGDFASACRELRARNHPNYDADCFHSQQCVEKLLKAVLAERDLPIRRTHDLEVLLDDCLTVAPLWEAIRPDCQLLTQYAVQFRYPGEFADKDEARDAVKAMRRLREEAKKILSF